MPSDRDPAAGTDRYLRHRQIAGFDQDDLQRSRVAVIGAGAVGNEVVKNLVLLGVGHVDVYDLDRVEPHNLTRSVLLRERDIGEPKARSVVQRAAELDPNVQLRAFEGDVRDTLGPLRARSYRAIIGALDNFEARLALNQLCWTAGVDWINAAIDARYVSVERFAFGTAAAGRTARHDSNSVPPTDDDGCYECTLPASAYARIAERQSCGGLLRAAAAQRVMPTTTVTASLAGAQAVNQMLRAGAGSTRWLFDTHTGTSTVSRIARSAQCACCADERRSLAFAAWPHANGCELADRLERRRADNAATSYGAHADDELLLQLSDRIVIECRCPACGFEPANGTLPGQRASAVTDAVVVCPRCLEPSVQATLSDLIGIDELRGPLAGHALRVRYAMAGGLAEDIPYGLDFSDSAVAETPAAPFRHAPIPTSGG